VTGVALAAVTTSSSEIWLAGDAPHQSLEGSFWPELELELEVETSSLATGPALAVETTSSRGMHPAAAAARPNLL